MTTKTENLQELWIKAIQSKELPEDETVWLGDPKFAFLYAKYFAKKRWSEEQEGVFCTDMKALYNYAWWIKDILGEETPENLNNMVLMNRIESKGKDKEWVDLYLKGILGQK